MSRQVTFESPLCERPICVSGRAQQGLWNDSCLSKTASCKSHRPLESDLSRVRETREKSHSHSILEWEQWLYHLQDIWQTEISSQGPPESKKIPLDVDEASYVNEPCCELSQYPWGTLSLNHFQISQRRAPRQRTETFTFMVGLKSQIARVTDINGPQAIYMYTWLNPRYSVRLVFLILSTSKYTAGEANGRSDHTNKSRTWGRKCT